MLRKKDKKKSDTSIRKKKTKKSSSDSKEEDFGVPWDGASSGEVSVDDYLQGNESQYSNIYALSRLKKTDPVAWTVQDVGNWLDYIHLSEYRAEFMRQLVSGQELQELDQDDFTSLGVTKVGHRKRLETRIKMLKHGLSGALDQLSECGSESEHSSSNSSATTYSSTASGASVSSAASGLQGKMSADRVHLKCVFGNDISVLRVSPRIKIEELSKKLRKEYGSRMTMKYKDKEGDLIQIRKTKHFRHALKEWSGDGALKVYLSEKKKKISSRHAAVLDQMLDGVVTINSKGRILVFNKAAEEMFGYTRKRVVKKNVSVLMPDEIAQKHDDYIKRYIETKKGNIIGVGRVVDAKHKDGHTFPIHLSVSVSNAKGKTVFTGSMRKVEEGASREQQASHSSLESEARSMFALLENLLDACIVINEEGITQFYNNAAVKMFGWQQSEIVGKNVQLLMPSSVGDHTAFVRRYLKTGEGHVIGVGREVVAMRKDGEILPVHLSLTEQQLGGGKRFFTAIMRNVEADLQMRKSLLQQEREVIDALHIPGIIIDENCKIHAFNNAASELLGYKLIEVVGRNINMLMTGEDKQKHDSYVQTYVKSGQAKVLGSERNVIALHKDGSIMPVKLSVTMKRDGQRFIFTGILQRVD